jgi:phosphatidylglycerol:prolipoprotein diacylglycerol transferase
MYPVLFRIGSFEVTTFGVMVAVGALVGLWLLRRELERDRLPADAADAGIAGVFGGLIGAKLLWTMEHAAEAPLTELLFSRGGLSWYGGLIGGVAAGLAYMKVRRWPVIPILAAATPALAVGHLLGRIGCFLVGDDYGKPTDLPWGVAFPRGLPPTDVPVHPTQLYEAIGLGILGWLLMKWRRGGAVPLAVLGRYLVGAGLLRFGIEFIRVNERVALGLSVAHLVSIGAVVVGIAMLIAAQSHAPRRGVRVRAEDQRRP